MKETTLIQAFKTYRSARGKCLTVVKRAVKAGFSRAKVTECAIAAGFAEQTAIRRRRHPSGGARSPHQSPRVGE